MTWYVAMTLARAEASADYFLRQAGYETLFLRRVEETMHARRAVTMFRPYLSRYIPFEVQPHQGLYQATKTIGVSEVIGTGLGPLTLPEAVVEELRSRGDRNGLVDKPVIQLPRARFLEGERVRVTAGPLAGFFALVALDEGPAVRVWLAMFRGQIEATFDPVELERASQPSAGGPRQSANGEESAFHQKGGASPLIP